MRILFLFPQGSADTKENESNTLREKGFEFQKPRTWGINKRFRIKCDPSESVFPESSVQFSSSVMSDSLQPHGPQHARPPCPSPISRAYSNMSIESVMPSNHLILCRPLLFLPSIFPSIWVSSHQVVKVLEFQLQQES